MYTCYPKHEQTNYNSNKDAFDKYFEVILFPIYRKENEMKCPSLELDQKFYCLLRRVDSHINEYWIVISLSLFNNSKLFKFSCFSYSKISIIWCLWVEFANFWSKLQYRTFHLIFNVNKIRYQNDRNDVKKPYKNIEWLSAPCL